MKNPRSYKVSLHISHPKLPANDITPFFPLVAKYVRSIGAHRVSKSGNELGGIYSQTDISFIVSDGVLNDDEITVAEFIDNALLSLPRSAIADIVASGGVCFFLIGVFSDGNMVCDFNVELLARLQQHGIGLKLDFWGGN
jgi:hypothetical protein